MTKHKFFDALKDAAVDGWGQYKILPSIALAQAAHESAFGTSDLAVKASALFGKKKDPSETGLAYFHLTWEVIDGKRVNVIEPFEAYPSWSASMDGYYMIFHGSGWRKNNYKNVIGETDYKKAARALVEAPAAYATDPAYADKIIDTIEAYDLARFDAEAGASDTEKPEQEQQEQQKEVPDKMSKSIIIDPGHGGTDPGANGFGVREKEWTLRISLYQYERLKELGARVSITRTSDQSLNSTARTDKIRGNYDVCVSNHWNAFNGSARGVETIHSQYSDGSFARDLANGIVKATGIPLRRVFTRRLSSGADYYYMHRLTGSTETVIIEYGFIDNRADHNAYKKDSIFYAAAEAAIEAICKKAGIAYRKPGASSPAKPSVPGASLPSGNLYKVQAGAFKDKKNADDLHERLEAKGIDAFVIQRDGLYKVQAGAYSTRDNAAEQLDRVKGAGFDAYIAVEGGEPASSPEVKTVIAGAKLVKNEDAYFLATENIKVRNAPDVEATNTGTLPKGASINYKRVFEGNGYRWLEYTGNTGNTLYLPYRPLKGNTKSWGTFHSTRP